MTKCDRSCFVHRIHFLKLTLNKLNIDVEMTMIMNKANILNKDTKKEYSNFVNVSSNNNL